MSHLYDDRLYIFGGMKDDGKPILDNLMWTYDINKKCWFGI